MSSWFSQETCQPAFDDKLTPLVSFGLPFPQACCKHLKTNFKRSRIYIIASASLSKNTSYVDQLKSELDGLVVGVRIGISPHKPISEIVDILADVKVLEIDCIVTLGAGSITDGAKLPTALLICIPTSLSGAEYQAIAGATDTKSKAKRVFEPMLGPNLVIQDPQLATTTPQKTWLSSGIRAVDHCVEILCSLKSNAVADEWAHEPEDLDARHLCQKGVMKAIRAVSCDVPLGASHAIGHQLGPLGVGHGETSCILLPEVCKFNARKGANNDRQKQTVEVLLKNKDVKSILAKADASSEEPDLGDVLDLIIRELGMPRTLEAVGVTPDSFKILAANSLSDLWIKTNAYPITRGEEVIEILEAVSGP
ncbi:alcohol dehydrogenase [Fusarium acutatum]|uniref:Alcohol dehydrogenase n=1 Tax=Fusarium acutatum TaxID=78861 RepID=A0A8H4NDT6_9HYPO|nr:alcohol dehydrogenase [Fusarium acutatum]